MRVCEHCATEIPPSKPRNTKYCRNECRIAAGHDRQHPEPRDPVVTKLPTAPESPPAVNVLVDAVRKELGDAGRLDTTIGGQALTLAEAMDGAGGAALAALSRELRTVMASALQGVKQAMDPIDELRLRRDRKSG